MEFPLAETVDNIFLVGHEGLLHLMRNGPRNVQADMTAVFACLLKKGIDRSYLLVSPFFLFRRQQIPLSEGNGVQLAEVTKD